MDKRFKIMDGKTRHLSPLPREIALLPRIASIGFLPAKRDRIRQTFDSCNFSFIMQGRGDYLLRGKRWPVEAPCLLIQWPGEPMDYGPEPEWSELYFIYPPETFELLCASGLMTPEIPVREMRNIGTIGEKADLLRKELDREEISADRIDLLCYDLLLETRLKSEENILTHSRIPEIRRRLERNPGHDIDCAALASEFGMSLSSLRRYWRRYHGEESFSDYRNSCFLRKSCRLLVETNLRVKEIAVELDFSDPFYFSRKFRQLAGISPLEYRKRNQMFPEPDVSGSSVF